MARLWGDIVSECTVQFRDLEKRVAYQALIVWTLAFRDNGFIKIEVIPRRFLVIESRYTVHRASSSGGGNWPFK